MKEKYFTRKNIDDRGQELVSMIRRRQFPKKIDGKIALLILDMQDYFLDPDSHAYIPSADAIIGKINKLSEVFNSQKLPVFCTQHINMPGQAGMMEAWWDDLLTDDHTYKNLSKDLSGIDCTRIRKSQYDAFYQTDLNEELQSRGVTDVVVTGVMTHLCCETTARSAFVNGFNVWFMVDGTATYNLDFHMNSIKNLNHGFVYPLLVDELIEVINK